MTQTDIKRAKDMARKYISGNLACLQASATCLSKEMNDLRSEEDMGLHM